MPPKFRAPSGFVRALLLSLVVTLPTVAVAKGARKGSDQGSDKGSTPAKEISADDKLDKQMDWENKVLGPNTIKKIDLAKIQKLQAEEMARREKQEKLDQVEKDRKEREAAAAAAAQRNVKAAGTHDVPDVQEAPPPPKQPVEKHDDAFVDKVLSGKAEKKKVSTTNDDVDKLLNSAKQDKAPAAKGGKAKSDSVDALLATADKQTAIKTTKKPVEPVETISAEAAAREATLKAIAAAAAKAQEERNRNKRPVVPDAAMLRAQAAARSQPAEPAPTKASARSTGWTDPFASDGASTSSGKGRGKVTAAAATVPATTSRGASGRHSPSTRPAGNDSWQDPFDSGPAKARPAPKAAPAGRPGKRPANWKDPFA